MAHLWNTSNASSNAPAYVVSVAPGTGVANVTGKLAFVNTTPSAFVNNQVYGVFSVNTGNTLVQSNSTVGGAGIHQGWVSVRRGTGGVATITVAGGGSGSGFANGEKIDIANGSANGKAYLTSNATGNLVSATLVTNGSGWPNTSIIGVTFRREQHITSLGYTGTATGFNNTDVITVSNSSVNTADLPANFVTNATATLVTNSTGGLAGNSAITVTAVGLFGNVASQGANSTVVIHVANSTGGNSAGSGATFSAGLGTSTGGTLTLTLGGRAGRVQYETLVATVSQK